MEDIRARAAAMALPLNSQSPYISPRATAFNRYFAVIYSGAILALFYYHMTSLLKPISLSSFFVSLSLFVSDVVLAFLWASAQSFRMNPIRRREFPENLKKLLKKDSDFPAIDVFICTADTYKEPPMNVVNTALSVLAYDYPTSKISVYVSDDGGSAVVLFAFMEAARFAAEWLPFCRKNNVIERNPKSFFASNKVWNFETNEMKIMYEKMKMKIEKVLEKGNVGDEFINGEEERTAFNPWTTSFTSQHHPTVIQVLLESGRNMDISGESLPNLIYVSRQKNANFHHQFKAGALNTLLRVSATMTNAPIILTLDCDMYSNDPQTPTRVLCYFLDPKLGDNLGYVQFPQRFHGVNKNDIYGSELKHVYLINSAGMDGLLGPYYVGTGCFFIRQIFFGGPLSTQLSKLGPNHVVERSIQCGEILDAAHIVASCDYEKNNTKWGTKLGFKYGTLVEDFYTSYQFQSEGWKSIFCNPNRAAFYGAMPINLYDMFEHVKRCGIGFLEVGFSKCSPITFGIRCMGFFMSLPYFHSSFWPFWSIPITIYAFLPQLALINSTPIFPKVWDAWFALYMFLFLGAYIQDLVEFVLFGGTLRKWWNDQRMWSAKAVSCLLLGTMEFMLKCLGTKSSFSFTVTSKTIDEEQMKRYEQELFEFGVFSPTFLLIAMVANVNLVGFIGGLIGIWRSGGVWELVFGQILVAAFGVVNCWPVYEAMALRNDGGKLPTKLTLLSLFLALLLCSFVAFLC